MAGAAVDAAAVADARVKRIRCGSGRKLTLRVGGGQKPAVHGPAGAAAAAAEGRLSGMGLY
jgi:hypothetical protein